MHRPTGQSLLCVHCRATQAPPTQAAPGQSRSEAHVALPSTLASGIGRVSLPVPQPAIISHIEPNNAVARGNGVALEKHRSIALKHIGFLRSDHPLRVSASLPRVDVVAGRHTEDTDDLLGSGLRVSPTLDIRSVGLVSTAPKREWGMHSAPSLAPRIAPMQRPEPKRLRTNSFGALSCSLSALTLALGVGCSGARIAGTSVANVDTPPHVAPSRGESPSPSVAGPRGRGAVARGDFECRETGGRQSAPPDAIVHEEAPLRRLSREQLFAVLNSLIRHYFADAEAPIEEALFAAHSALPLDRFVDHPEEGQRLFTRSDQTFSDAWVRTEIALARAVAREFTKEGRLGGLVGDCAVDADRANDAQCLDAFVRDFGLRTHRRPLDAQEFEFYRHEAYLGGARVVATEVAELVTIMLSQPRFISHVEGDGELDAYELASRLSFQFWDDMPDDDLFEAARSGRLMTPEGWTEQVNRVIADWRTARAMGRFLDEWLKFDRVVPLSAASGAGVDTLVGSMQRDQELDWAIRGELHDLFMHVLASGGTFRDFFLTDSTLTENPTLAAIYGVPPAEAGRPRAMPPERHGILSRVGMLLPRSDVSPPIPGVHTHPILRGVLIRRQILCDTIPPPPPGVTMNLPPIDRTNTSSRDYADQLTGVGYCGGCHSLLNPAGFALEEFDPFGRYRTEEKLFTSEGQISGSVGVDPRAEFHDLDQPVRGAAELADALYATERPSACFARHYVRFTLGRAEDPAADGCLLRRVDEAIDADRPLREVLAEVVASPHFRTRTVYSTRAAD